MTLQIDIIRHPRKHKDKIISRKAIHGLPCVEILDPDTGAHIWRVNEPKRVIGCKSVMIVRTKSKPDEGIFILPEVMPDGEVVPAIVKVSLFIDDMITEVFAKPVLSGPNGQPLVPAELSETIKIDVLWHDGTMMSLTVELANASQFQHKLSLLLFMKSGLLPSEKHWEQPEIEKAKHILGHCEI